MTARRPRELQSLVRERRAVVDFLLAWQGVDSATWRRRAYMPPSAPAASQVVKDMERLSHCWDDLERFDVSIFDPVHHAREAIAAKMRKRPGELHHSATLYRAIEDLGHALGVHTGEAERRAIGWSIVRLRELTGWTAQD